MFTNLLREFKALLGLSLYVLLVGVIATVVFFLFLGVILDFLLWAKWGLVLLSVLVVGLVVYRRYFSAKARSRRMAAKEEWIEDWENRKDAWKAKCRWEEDER